MRRMTWLIEYRVNWVRPWQQIGVENSRKHAEQWRDRDKRLKVKNGRLGEKWRVRKGE